MKRTCNNCRALIEINGKYTCTLNYKLESVYFEKVYLIGARPKESCPKPITLKKLYTLI